MNGKGDSPRPLNRHKYEEGFKAIRWKHDKKSMQQVWQVLYGGNMPCRRRVVQNHHVQV